MNSNAQPTFIATFPDVIIKYRILATASDAATQD